MKIQSMTLILAGCLLALLSVGRPVSAQEADPRDFLDIVERYLSMLDHMQEITSDPRGALLMAQNSIKEIYEQAGRKAEAIEELKDVLEGLTDPAARTAVRFAIADLYKETGDREKALAELREIVAENKALLARR